jgi:hypothetical protein
MYYTLVYYISHVFKCCIALHGIVLYCIYCVVLYYVSLFFLNSLSYCFKLYRLFYYIIPFIYIFFIYYIFFSFVLYINYFVLYWFYYNILYVILFLLGIVVSLISLPNLYIWVKPFFGANCNKTNPMIDLGDDHFQALEWRDICTVNCCWTCDLSGIFRTVNRGEASWASWWEIHLRCEGIERHVCNS